MCEGPFNTSCWDWVKAMIYCGRSVGGSLVSRGVVLFARGAAVLSGLYHISSKTHLGFFSLRFCLASPVNVSLMYITNINEKLWKLYLTSSHQFMRGLSWSRCLQGHWESVDLGINYMPRSTLLEFSWKVIVLISSDFSQSPWHIVLFWPNQPLVTFVLTTAFWHI